MQHNTGELGLHGVIDQAQSRGDVPVAAHSRTGLRDTTDYDGASKAFFGGGVGGGSGGWVVEDIVLKLIFHA